MQKRSSSSVKVFYPEFNQSDLLQTLKERIEGLNKELPLIKVILFGSYAKGNFTVGSDVDLLIIYKGVQDRMPTASLRNAFPSKDLNLTFTLKKSMGR